MTKVKAQSQYLSNINLYSMAGMQALRCSYCADSLNYRSSSGQNSCVIGRVDHLVAPKTLPIMARCRSYLLCGCKGRKVDKCGAVLGFSVPLSHLVRASGHFSRPLIWNGTPDVQHTQAREFAF